MGAVNTTYTFTATDTITSTKMNDIIDQTTFTNDAVFDTTLIVAAGKLKVNSQGIKSTELANNAVTTIAIADASVTLAKLDSSIVFVPTGAIMPFAMNSAPAGWLEANGGEYSKVDPAYLTLFNAIGILYGETNGAGGIGTTHFKTPNLRGYFVRGFGPESGSSSFGSPQEDALKSHTHTAIQTTDFSGAFASNSGRARYGGNGITGSTGETETRPKNIAMLYCIKI